MPDLSSLANIPGYGAYIAKKQMNEAQTLQDIQQASSLLQLRNAIQGQQHQAQEREMFAGAADPEAAMTAALRAGRPDIAAKLAPLIEARRKAQPQPQAIGSGGLRLPDGTIVPPAARPEQPKAPPPSNLGRLMAERDLLPPNDPRRVAYDAAIKKETERAPQADKAYPVVTTSEGIFERRPEGLVRLTDPKTGQPLVASKPGAEGLTPENAGKVAMSQQGIEGIKTTRNMIFNPDGTLNRGLVMALNLPVVSGLPGNSQARIARSAMRNAVEAKLRLETGAAATEPEVKRTLDRFMPTVADTPQSAKFKLDQLEKFFSSSLSMTKGIPTAPKTQNVVDFGSLK